VRLPLRTGLLVVAGLAIGGLATGAVPAGSALASGQVCEGVVVDEGTGAAPAPQTAEVAPGASDLDALGAAGDTATENSSGLVCAINAYPLNGLQSCLNTAGSLYYYWSYWEGDPATNTWTYAPVGPAEHTVSAGQTYVEGWRYQDPGPDGPSATKPSVTPAAAFAQACPGVTPVSSSGGGGGGGSGGGGGGGGAPGGTVTTTSPPATTATGASGTAGGAVAPAPAPASAPGAPGPTSAAPNRSGTGPGSVAPTGGSGSTTTTTTTASGTAPLSTRRAAAAKLALASAAAHRGSGGDSALPVILVAVLIGLIGAAAWYRWRRRPVEE
jgi:hypothetical protein